MMVEASASLLCRPAARSGYAPASVACLAVFVRDLASRRSDLPASDLPWIHPLWVFGETRVGIGEQGVICQREQTVLLYLAPRSEFHDYALHILFAAGWPAQSDPPPDLRSTLNNTKSKTRATMSRKHCSADASASRSSRRASNNCGRSRCKHPALAPVARSGQGCARGAGVAAACRPWVGGCRSFRRSGWKRARGRRTFCFVFYGGKA